MLKLKNLKRQITEIYNDVNLLPVDDITMITTV